LTHVSFLRLVPAVLVASASLTPSADSTTLPVESGSAQGIALWAKVSDAYRSVPGAVTVERVGPITVRFDDVLQHGIATAITAKATSPSEVTYLVGTIRAGTYVKDPGRTCWRHVDASDPQALDDLGNPFLSAPRMLFSKPRMAGVDWLLPVVFTAKGGPTDVVLRIHRRSSLVRSFTIASGSHHGTGSVRALARAPTIPRAEPRC
jgi:hypothetical protein